MGVQNLSPELVGFARGALLPGPVTGLCGITLAIAASLAALRVALVANDYERRLADSHFGNAALRARR